MFDRIISRIRTLPIQCFKSEIERKRYWSVDTRQKFVIVKTLSKNFEFHTSWRGGCSRCGRRRGGNLDDVICWNGGGSRSCFEPGEEFTKRIINTIRDTFQKPAFVQNLNKYFFSTLAWGPWQMLRTQTVLGERAWCWPHKNLTSDQRFETKNWICSSKLIFNNYTCLVNCWSFFSNGGGVAAAVHRCASIWIIFEGCFPPGMQFNLMIKS